MSVRECRSSFARMCDTWVCTVRRDRNSCARDLRVGHTLRDQPDDLHLGRGEAVPALLGAPVLHAWAAPDPVRAEPGLGARQVPAGAELRVLRERVGELARAPGRGHRSSASATPAASSACARGSSRPAASYCSAARNRTDGVVLDQSPAVQRDGLPVRHVRAGADRLGPLHDGVRRAVSPTASARRTASAKQIGGLLDLLRRLRPGRRSAPRAPRPARRPVPARDSWPAPANR